MIKRKTTESGANATTAARIDGDHEETQVRGVGGAEAPQQIARTSGRGMQAPKIARWLLFQS